MKNINLKNFLSARRILELFMALCVIFAPSFLSLMGDKSLFFLLFVSALVLLYRIIDTKSIFVGPFFLIFSFLSLYSVAGLFWAVNKGAQIYTIARFLLCVMFCALCGDYFKCDNPNELKERMSFLIFISASVLSVYNILYWAFEKSFSISKYKFCAGLLSSDMLGIYLLSGLWCGLICYKRYKSANIKLLLIIMASAVIFSFILTRSFSAFFLLCIFIINYISKNRKNFLGKARYYVIFLSILAIVFLCEIIKNINFLPFKDAVLSGLYHPFGLGGGFTERFEFYRSAFYETPVSTISSGIISSCGIFGLLAVLILLMWVISLALLKSSGASAFLTFVCIFSLFFDAVSPASIALLISFAVYCELRGGASRKRKTSRAGIIAVSLSLICVLSVYFFIQQICFTSAFKTNNADLTVSRYKNAFAMASFDSECSYNLAFEYYEKYVQDKNFEDFSHALFYLDKAKKSSKKDIRFITLEAKLYSESENFDKAIEILSTAQQESKFSYQLKLDLADTMIKKMEKLTPGCEENVNMYNKLSNLSAECDDYDTKKLLNDKLDFSQKYMLPITYTDEGVQE